MRIYPPPGKADPAAKTRTPCEEASRDPDAPRIMKNPFARSRLQLRPVAPPPEHEERRDGSDVE